MVWPTNHDVALGEFDAMELPGQQLPSANATTPLDHYLKLDIKVSPGCQRLTGIVASMGKSTTDVEVVEEMLAAGMNIALINFVFGNAEEHVEIIKTVRQAAKNYSIKMEKMVPLAIAARLSGKKIRTGRIAEVTLIFRVSERGSRDGGCSTSDTGFTTEPAEENQTLTNYLRTLHRIYK